jgi:hypothetical protein
MAVFFGNNAAFTPGTQNWTLDAGTTVAGQMARVLEVSWGGELTTTTAMRTRWVRPTNSGATTFLAIGIVQGGGGTVITLTRFGCFSTVPTLPTAPAALYATSWNAHGGIGRWLAAPGEEWYLIAGTVTGKNQVVCVNDIGTTATSMSAGAAWEEM